MMKIISGKFIFRFDDLDLDIFSFLKVKAMEGIKSTYI
jgi:hypothetical protein